MVVQRLVLLERATELGCLHAVVDAARAHDGALVTVEGEAGIGKTSVLKAAISYARTHGVQVLAARGTLLERELGFGMVRMLFERFVANLGEDERGRVFSGGAHLAENTLGSCAEGGATVAAPSFAVQHALYWLASNIGDRTPLLLVVDDAQWCDGPSLQWLVYLTRRLEQVPVSVVVAWRTGEPDPPRELLDALHQQARGGRLRPAVLTEEASIQLVRSSTDVSVDVARACHESTCGNPFLLGELAALLGQMPSSASAELVRRMGPPEVRRSVVARLRRLGEDAVALARAVAVLDADAEPRFAYAAAGLAQDSGPRVAAALRMAGLISSSGALRFVHPLVRVAVYDDFPAEMRAAEHRRVAEMLDAEADPERAGVHLLASTPAGDPWVVQTLRAAAARARNRGAPESGLALLDRALAEPCTSVQRPQILLEAGRIALALARRDAKDYLREAHAMAASPAARALAAAELARALIHEHPADGIALLREAIGDLGASDEVMWERLRLELLTLEASTGAGRPAEDVEADIRAMHQEAAPGSATRIGAACLLIWHLQMSAQALRADEVSDLACELTDIGPLLAVYGAGYGPMAWAASVLAEWDHVETAETMFEQAVQRARRDGDHFALSTLAVSRAVHRSWCGRFDDAEADAQEALASSVLTGSWAGRRGAMIAMTWSLTGRGSMAEIEGMLTQHGLDGAVGRSMLLDGNLLLARANLRRHQGRVDDAREDAGRMLEMFGLTSVNPANRMFAWLPRFLVGSGDAERARSIATRAVSAARGAGLKSLLGIALHSQGLAQSSAGSVPTLTEAVAALSGSAFRWEYAEALVDLGAALRRSNERVASRSPLQQGMAIAEEIGARGLAERARQELLATGARPRRAIAIGTDALTASERRVALLAADGRTIAEIAQALFVTRKTVESHLYAGYRKLGVTGREQLADLLRE